MFDDDNENKDENAAKNAETYNKIMDLFDRWDAQRKSSALSAKKFYSLLCKGVPDVVIDYFPELKKYRKPMKKLLKEEEIIELLLSGLLEHLDAFSNGYYQDYKVEGSSIPDREDKEGIAEMNEYHKNFLKNTAPADMHEYFNLNHEIDLKRIAFEHEFPYRIHDKILEISLICYPGIMDFTSGQLRGINDSSWVAALEIKDVFLYDFGEFILNRFVDYEFDHDLRKIIIP